MQDSDLSENEKLEVHGIPQKGNYSQEAWSERLEFLKSKTGISLPHVANTIIASDSVRNNIENFIGAVQIPVGLAGPLLIHRQSESEYAYAPIATTEGALVASIVRGAKAISLSGGVSVRTLAQRMIRAPMFEFQNMNQAIDFSNWVRENFASISEKCGEFSNFAKLTEIKVHSIGKTVHLRFVFETGDAAGQNMTTTCTWNASQWMIKQTTKILGFKPENFYLEGNLASDKKVSFLATSEGRGTQAMAECTISRAVLKKILKTEPAELVQLYQRGQSARIFSGMQGFNVNLANVVAGIYAATGQDIACVHESSVGQLHLELKGEDLYASLYMPSLIVGTVGGGVNLATQRELLELMGCYGKGKFGKFAENIVGFALALDLSTICAIASDQFAQAHERLGRNRDCDWLKRTEINDKFFAQVIASGLTVENPVISKITPIKDFITGDSIITDAATKVTQRVCGLFPFEVKWSTSDSEFHKTNLLLKIKPLDEEVMLATELMVTTFDEKLVTQVKKFRDRSPFRGCHTRELEVSKIKDERFTKISPKTFGAFQNDDREIYILAQELLENVDLLNSASSDVSWGREHIKAAIDGIAGFHSIYFAKPEEVGKLSFLAFSHTAESMTEMAGYWMALAEHAHEEFPNFFKQADLKKHEQIISEVGHWWKGLEAQDQCVIHNDFNPRNIAFRKAKEGPLLCAFDWELATKHVPQRDLAELLAFTLNEETSEETVTEYLEYHRQKLGEYSEVIMPGASAWRLGYKYSLYDFLINRLSMYFVAHTHKRCEFLERTYRTLRHLIQVEERWGN